MTNRVIKHVLPDLPKTVDDDPIMSITMVIIVKKVAQNICASMRMNVLYIYSRTSTVVDDDRRLLAVLCKSNKR